MKTDFPKHLYKCKGHPDVRHVGCNGEIAVGACGYVQLPIGFGFPDNSGKFAVDTIRYTCYSGHCMKCGADGTFVRVDVKAKHKRKYPRSINEKVRRYMNCSIEHVRPSGMYSAITSQGRVMADTLNGIKQLIAEREKK